MMDALELEMVVRLAKEVGRLEERERMMATPQELVEELTRAQERVAQMERERDVQLKAGAQ